jgi:hypothetical protein
MEETVDLIRDIDNQFYKKNNMANNFLTTVNTFYNRVRGQGGANQVRASDQGLVFLDTPLQKDEQDKLRKIQTVATYIRNKNWNRRHVEYFDDYRRMVTSFPIIKGAVDIYAEEACAIDSDGDVFKVICDNIKVKKLLEECYFKNLRLNSRLRQIAREVCKFGNVFSYLITRPKIGVTDMVYLQPEMIMRDQMYDPSNLSMYRFMWYGGGGNALFEPWEIVHFRNIEDIEMEPYGQSILRCILDTWRRVVLIREALVIYRVTRAPNKLLFKIGTDGLSGDEALRFAEEVKRSVKKKPLVNPDTGEIDFKYNPLSIEDDIYLPVYEGSPSDVNVLEGAQNLDTVEDYKIIKDDLFAGLKIPKSYLSFEEDLCLFQDTAIRLLDGTLPTIKELVKRYDNGEKLYVYSTNEVGDIVVGEVEWAGITRKENIKYKITLDNGKTAEVTNNHPYRLRDGTYKRADELKIGESLMPLYTRISEKRYPKDNYFGYEEVWHNRKQKWEKTHQIVGKWKYGENLYQESQRIILHHRDFSKKNNHPDNLLKMERTEHILLHSKCSITPETRIKLKAIQQTSAFKEKCSEIRIKGFKEHPWRRKSISVANKLYNKASLMLTAYIKKITSGEISQKQEKNGNYGIRLSKEEIHDILKENIFYNINQINQYIKANYSTNHKWYYTKEELASILDITVARFEMSLLHDKKGKTIKYLDFSKLEEIALNSDNCEDFCRKAGKSKTGLYNYFKRNNLNLFVWFKNIKELAPHNHCIANIEIITLEIPEEVYDLQIKNYHNFALESGVFVHNSNKAALSEEDIRFAKTIQKHQAELADGIMHIGLVHLFFNGCSKEEMESFTIQMNNPSIASEKKKMELTEARLNIAHSAWDSDTEGLNLMSYAGVLSSILKFTDEEIKQTIKSQEAEKKIQWRLRAIYSDGFYTDPEGDFKDSDLKNMTNKTGTNRFDNLVFETNSAKSILRKKIDQEIDELFPKTVSRASAQKIQLLKLDNSLTKNLKITRKQIRG